MFGFSFNNLKLLGVSDTHINRQLFTGQASWQDRERIRYHNTSYSRLVESQILNHIDAVDGVILNGDIFNISQYTERHEWRFIADDITNRFMPESYLEALLQKYPEKKFFYIPGNHDGDLLKPERPNHVKFREYLKALSQKFTNFAFADELAAGNSFFIHGHQFSILDQIDLDEVKEGKIADLARSRILKPQLFKQAEMGIGEFHLFMGHIHHGRDDELAVKVKTAAGVKEIKFLVQNLGCTLPADRLADSQPNFKIIEYGENGLVSVVRNAAVEIPIQLPAFAPVSR